MQRRVLFLTSNGAGLGHVTRCMAIARRLPSDIESVFLTLSQALPVIVEQGFHAEYLMSASYSGVANAAWNGVLARRLRHMLRLYAPAVVVFDGTFPYRGLREVMTDERAPAYVWSRRAMWRPSDDRRALGMSDLFDAIIEPGEFAADADRGATVAHRHEVHAVSPITLLDPEELLDRERAEAELGLEHDHTNVLIQLGAGNINDIDSEVGMVVERLRRWPAVQLVVAQPTIAGAPLALPDDVTQARTYPLSRLLRAFDMTVTAAGYNSFHEAVAFGTPALYVPNDRTAVDDQVARARFAEQIGGGMTWTPRTPERLDEVLRLMAHPTVRDDMAQTLMRCRTPNGAAAAADILTALSEKRLEDMP